MKNACDVRSQAFFYMELFCFVYVFCNKVSHFGGGEHTVFAERRVEDILIDFGKLGRLEVDLFRQLFAKRVKMSRDSLDCHGQGALDMIADPFCRRRGLAEGGNSDGEIVALDQGGEENRGEFCFADGVDLRAVFSADLEDTLDFVIVNVGDDDELRVQTGDQRLCVGSVASMEGDFFHFRELLDGRGDFFCGNGQRGTAGEKLADFFVRLTSTAENEDRAFFNVAVKREIVSHNDVLSSADDVVRTAVFHLNLLQ